MLWVNMASLTNVTFPEEDYEVLKAATVFYRYDSVSAFFRAAGHALIEHYGHKDELVSPLQFAVAASKAKPRRAVVT